MNNALHRRASIGIYMPFFSPNRGGPDVTAVWLVQALCRYHDVTLVTTRHFDLSFFNRFAGTTLTAKDFRIRCLPSVPCPPSAPMSALQGPLFQRLARRCAREFDVNISAMNPLDFGVRGIHFLAGLNWLGMLTRPPAGCPPPEHRTTLRRLYHYLCSGLYKRSGRDYMREDVLISNSEWVASSLRDLGIDSPVIHPPVPFVSHPTDWEHKLSDFVWIGRIAPSKRLETAINIVGRLREMGLALKLHVVGNATDKGYENTIRDFVRPRNDWVILEGPLYGHEKERFLTQFKYAIHTQVDEAFGITLVELLKSGCILFGPNSCGAAEIINHDDLLFDSEVEAVFKILRVFNEPRRIERLRSHLQGRAECFSTDRFCKSVRDIVAQMPKAEN